MKKVFNASKRAIEKKKSEEDPVRKKLAFDDADSSQKDPDKAKEDAKPKRREVLVTEPWLSHISTKQLFNIDPFWTCP